MVSKMTFNGDPTLRTLVPDKTYDFLSGVSNLDVQNFKITATWRGNAVADKEMTYAIQFQKDPCEVQSSGGLSISPENPTISKEVLLGQGSDTTLEISIPGWTPSDCLPSKYAATLGSTITTLIAQGYMTADFTKNPGELVVKKEMPIDRAQTITFTI